MIPGRRPAIKLQLQLIVQDMGSIKIFRQQHHMMKSKFLIFSKRIKRRLREGNGKRGVLIEGK